MSDSHTAAVADPVAASGRTSVNDCTIHVATVNGSGSQSSNSVLMRAIFQMGIPVSGKNLFPSNIAGLPTWFTIRANRDGWVGRKKVVDVLVCMNPATAREDVETLHPGAICIFDEPLALSGLRSDVTFYPVPFAKLAQELIDDSRLRKLLANMLYVGVVAELLGIERDELVSAVEKQFSGKAKAVSLNVSAIDRGMSWARENLGPQQSFRLQRMDATRGKIIIDGNAAGAIGSVFAGVTVVTWYPITPSSSLVETMIDYLRRYRVDADGRASFAVVQAEDEIAAIGMVLGAGWAGARSMTSTSGPGISLMAEFAGYGYFAEVPGVIWDIQRVGPSTGLPTRTAQADLSFVYGLSHGDTRHVVLLPGSVRECYDFAMEAFDLAEGLQTPVFVLSDLDLGMNMWMSDPFPYPEKPMQRGKVLSAEKLTELEGNWGRYRDVDGDAIPYRTLPGTNHPSAAYFTRGSGHDPEARYTEKPQDYQQLMDRLARKHETARSMVPAPVIDARGVDAAIIAYGSSDVAVEEARVQLRDDGIETSYMRIRALPFTAAVREFVQSHARVYVVEQNRDGQMTDLLKLELEGEAAAHLRKVLHYDGMPIDAAFIAEAVRTMEGEI